MIISFIGGEVRTKDKGGGVKTERLRPLFGAELGREKGKAVGGDSYGSSEKRPYRPDRQGFWRHYGGVLE